MADNLKNESCSCFTEMLSSKSPVPGGGGAAALCGALGTALCAMAGNLSSGKQDSKENEEKLISAVGESLAIRSRFLELIDEDAEAFKPLAEAYRLPKDNPEHRDTLFKASIDACRAPIEMMRCCRRAIQLLDFMKSVCADTMISDVGCGAALAEASIKAAAMNVLVNTRAFRGEREADELEKDALQMLKENVPAARNISSFVLTGLSGEDLDG